MQAFYPRLADSVDPSPLCFPYEQQLHLARYRRNPDSSKIWLKKSQCAESSVRRARLAPRKRHGWPVRAMPYLGTLYSQLQKG